MKLDYSNMIRLKLLRELKNGKYAACARLPRETVLAEEEISKLLEVSVGSPLLNMKEIDYDIDGNVIFYSRQYFLDEFFSHTVMRKNL